LAILATAISGCGGVECFPVTGTITLDGEPLADAKVSFIPNDEAGIPTIGITDTNGTYTLAQTARHKGAPAGSYTIRITTYREGRPDGESPIPDTPERVPSKYNLHTKLTADVGRKENGIDFELSSKAR
jgi:hypothetical protein